ncbi:chitobiase [Psychromonas sp. psych-6C06]|uniref:glycoside hydrolase family 9 protein n=1 Tax=Psychromonas sp. psych-6C06 TaxID=2058089 RepID=UPI000C31E63A|nr:glycoside hydrolase family 9 protein [Psychromonas sp. psych-6C06]PKF62833.1 chitobiase [Psychromonas sp. psych-6C06]
MNKLLINHLGYDCNAPKQIILQQTSPLFAEQEVLFELLNSETLKCEFSGYIDYIGSVDNWSQGYFSVLDFSAFEQQGSYIMRVNCLAEVIESETFVIKNSTHFKQSFDLLLSYFSNQRCQDMWDEKDRSIGFYGDKRKDNVDVHGGWYDASGDKSKYLSHLSYANYMNPQQTPMVVWNMLASFENPLLSAPQCEALKNEILYGAEFLARMQDEQGYFYTTVFDQWSHDPEKRMICSYKTQSGYLNSQWQAGWRMGGGMAIASLARASLIPCELRELYLHKAEIGFWHLVEHNLSYLDDGIENIIDDYCALLAAIELYAATKQSRYQKVAVARVSSLIKRLTYDSQFYGWLSADHLGERPYFHAAEEGLPMIALLRFLSVMPVEDSLRDKIHSTLQQMARCYVKLAEEVNNPFSYPRMYKMTSTSPKASSFFYPHENESGYWWQGENARLASLASAFKLLVKSGIVETTLQHKLALIAQSSLDWILGKNPMDICMLNGLGYHNPPEFDPLHESIKGGICNGITSGLWDENSIAFSPTHDPNHAWRWSEQWIPHSAWFLLAISC